MTRGSKKRGRKPGARPPARPGTPARPAVRPAVRPGMRPGRRTRTIGQFRNLGFVAALVAAVIAAIALIGVANLVQGGDDNTNTDSSTPIDIPPFTAHSDGMTLGNADAPVTIYEYSDFQCPFCRRAAAEIVPELDKEYLATGKAKLVFKNFAFLGQESVWAAQAAACASDQNKFWEYHDKLYEEQRGENKGAFKVENLKLFAQEIGLDQAQFNTCFDEGQRAADIADQLDEGKRRGVNATPTFFVNQTQVQYSSFEGLYAALGKAIDDELVRLGLATPEPTPAPTGTPEAAAQYEVLNREDVSFGNVVRLEFKVRVPGGSTEAELRQISQELIDKEKEAQPVNAIALFFYLPDTDVAGPYTAGKADWAPDGKWENAGEVEAGDYSRHQLVVESGGLFAASTPSGAAADIPEETRRRIFYDLVVAQDSGMGDQEAYDATAQRYGVTTDVVRSIAVEGVTNGWPMP